MRSCLARLCAAVALSVGTSPLPAQNPPGTPPPLPQNPPAQRPATPAANAPAAQAQPTSPAPNVPAAQPTAGPVAAPLPAAPGTADELVTLILPDADIDTVLSALEIYTGRIILRPQTLTTATYNLKIKNPIPRWEAILAIETILALNGIGVAPLGDRFLKVVNLNAVRQEAPEMITGSALDRPPSSKVATKLFQLEFLRVAEFAPMLMQGVLNAMYGGPLQFPNANAVLITDTISNLQRVEMLLQQLDRPVAAGMKPRFFTLKNGAKASDVVNKLRTILTGTLSQQLGQATTYSADDRTNQIIVVTDPRQWDFFTELIERLDQRSDPNTRTDVFYLKHAKAEDVVKVLIQIIQGQTTAMQKANPGSVRTGTIGAPTPQMPQQPNMPAQPNIISGTAANNPNFEMGANEFSALMTVVNDTRSNSVVVFGTTDDIRLAKELVDKLDIVLAQVRIEVVIAEVTLSDNDQTGISALGLRLEGDKLVGFSGTFGSGDTPSLTIGNGTVTRPGTVSGHMDLAAEIGIRTTPRKSNNTILSHPAIVTSHGKKAEIFNGETRPVVTGTLTGAGGTTTGLAQSSSVTQQQIGTRLTVTPFIGADGSVNLDVVQQVEDVAGEVLVDQNRQYIIGQRRTESNVSAKSGDILVFGGFQKVNNGKTTSRLGPIPIIGDIFGARTKTNSRQELVFFLRPTVLTNNPAIDNAETMRRIETLPTRDQIKQHLDPAYQPETKSVLDKILPK